MESEVVVMQLSALLFFEKEVVKMFHDLLMIGCAFVTGGAAVIVIQYFRNNKK